MSGFFSFLLGVAHSWTGKLLFIAILLAVYAIWAQPYMDAAQIYMLWFLNETVFKVIPFAGMQMLCTLLAIISTWKIIHWFIPHDDHATNPQQRQ